MEISVRKGSVLGEIRNRFLPNKNSNATFGVEISDSDPVHSLCYCFTVQERKYFHLNSDVELSPSLETLRVS